MTKEEIYKLVNNEDLSYEMAEQVMDEIMDGEASQIHMGAFLTALRMKGETIDEITACAAGMRKHCTRLLHDMDVLEIVGTGGDEANTFNISTVSSLVVSAAGIPVAKHGIDDDERFFLREAADKLRGKADLLRCAAVAGHDAVKLDADPLPVRGEGAHAVRHVLHGIALKAAGVRG